MFDAQINDNAPFYESKRYFIVQTAPNIKLE